MAHDEKILTKTLQRLETFTQADPSLEQYPTPPAMAAKLLLEHKSYLIGRNVLDLGAGTGILGIGALLLGAQKVTFIEKDKQACELLEKNLQRIRTSYDIGEAIIMHAALNLTDESADTTIMNPPFGTRDPHLDTQFLDYACAHSDTVITLHKTSTKEHIRQRVRHLGKKVLKEEDFSFVLKHTMPHHTKHEEQIAVTAFLVK